MERRLEISAFRNIGFKDGKPKKEGIILNHTLEKGNLGDLVILVGANNSGKSNVLDAIIAYRDRTIKDRDITDLYMEDECRKPILGLTCNNEKEKYGLLLYGNGKTAVTYPGCEWSKFVVDKAEIKIDNAQQIIDEINRTINTELSYVNQSSERLFSQLSHKYNLAKDSNGDIINKFVAEYIELFVKCLTEKTNEYKNFVERINYYFPILGAVKEQYNNYLNNENKKNSIDILNQKYVEKFGYNFSPTIYEYKQEKIGNADLESTYNYLNSSKFLLAVLRAINVNPSILTTAHNDMVKFKSRASLEKVQKDLNKKLERISRSFNKLYLLENDLYSFKFILESEKVFFTLYRGDAAISLDYQSTGFKWFFDLYFNLFASSNLNPGDIIIMDEPATNLHVKGQIELRLFLKEFAMKNRITIVLATHSPFLIDLDFLDELRIVVNKNGITSIENDFAAINPDDPDSLLPVKEALTIENHVLLDPDQNVVFVEGITDYNYLVAMKKILGYSNLTFLPIKGVGKKGMEKAISEKLIRIRKCNPFLLADSDAAGKAIKKANEESELRVMLLSEADPEFIEIEDLFDKDDATKFGIIDQNGKHVKHHSLSAIFKNRVISDPSLVSEKTKENFRKLFEAIID